MGNTGLYKRQGLKRLRGLVRCGFAAFGSVDKVSLALSLIRTGADLRPLQVPPLAAVKRKRRIWTARMLVISIKHSAGS